jgi:hypothetical protein
MAVKILTTQELTDLAITLFESKLNQTIPAVAKAFFRVVAAVLAASHTGLYRYAVERVIQNLALTATEEDLELIGREYGVERKPEETCQLEIQVNGIGTPTIPITTDWISDTNGFRFDMDAAKTLGTGPPPTITAQVGGPDPNMSIGETLTIDTPITGVLPTATVLSVLNEGVSREEQEVYRRRVLNEIRTVGGGGNGVDYRTWAEETAGCRQAFPYAGAPLVLGLTPLPGDRSVFVEADFDIDADGIAPSWLLDDVRDNINTDPATGRTRPGLGDFDSTLWVESIERTTFYNQVVGLSIDPAVEAQAKADIEQALLEYYLLFKPYLEGVDPPITQNNIITALKLGEAVQDVLNTYGATAQKVNFGTAPGVFTTLEYTLGQGELTKSGGVVYA